MLYFLGSFFFIVLFIILLILILGVNLLARLVGGVKNLWNIVTGKGFTTSSGHQNSQNRSYTYSNNTYSDNTSEQYGESEDQGNRPHSKGVFADDEGTYVDFEEIK